MKKRQIIFFIFTICFVIALIIFAIAKKSDVSIASTVTQFIFSPIQKTTLKASQSLHPKSVIDQLQEENRKLKTQIATLQLTALDNTALRDQFQTTNPSPKTLLPAAVVAMPSFFPGVSAPEELIIDKGKKDGVNIGSVVVYKDNLVGSITQSNNHFALVTVVGNKKTSFTAKTSQTGALGVIKGQGNGQMLLDNVVLSDTIKTGDAVVTNGDTSVEGKGYLPGLIIGKITSIEKSPSALFQKANVQSLIDITRIPIVFVIMNN